MHQIKLSDVPDAVALTRAVLQIGEMLGMYQAELARVLGLLCADIGAFTAAKRHLTVNTLPWERAARFVTLYEILYQRFAGDPVAMHHWLRTTQPCLSNTPLLAMVDEGRLGDVITCLQAMITAY